MSDVKKNTGVKNIVIENGIIGKFKPVPFDLTELESQISKLSYSGERLKKDERVENSKLPPFIIPFYELLYDTEKLPAETDLTNVYIAKYFDIRPDGKLRIKEKFNNAGLSNESFGLEGITARLLRSYPSLIRDIHFYVLCYEKGSFDDVYYDLRSDWLKGYDLMVNDNGVQCYVKLHFDSKRGNKFENKKHRRHDYAAKSNVTINLSIKPDNQYLCGQVYLYNEAVLEQLKSELSEISIK